MGIEETGILVVMVTVANQEEATRLATIAVDSRLAACVTTIPGVQSTYRWEGKVVNDREVLMVLKTTTERFQSLQDTIQLHHSYKVPEIIAIPVSRGIAPYLEWVRKETS
jgi:periplasmic divalent cation tolerance protein